MLKGVFVSIIAFISFKIIESKSGLSQKRPLRGLRPLSPTINLRPPCPKVLCPHVF